MYYHGYIFIESLGNNIDQPTLCGCSLSDAIHTILNAVVCIHFYDNYYPVHVGVWEWYCILAGLHMCMSVVDYRYQLCQIVFKMLAQCRVRHYIRKYHNLLQSCSLTWIYDALSGVCVSVIALFIPIINDPPLNVPISSDCKVT